MDCKAQNKIIFYLLVHFVEARVIAYMIRLQLYLRRVIITNKHSDK